MINIDHYASPYFRRSESQTDSRRWRQVREPRYSRNVTIYKALAQRVVVNDFEESSSVWEERSVTGRSRSGC